MTFLQHLEALRWHLIRGGIAILVLMVAAFLARELVVETILMGPSTTDFWTYVKLCELSHLIGTSDAFCVTELPIRFQNRTLTGQFTMHLLISAVAGLVVAFPYVFWEIWRFVKPGLHPHEAKRARGATFFVSMLFAMGVTFGYFVVAPLSVNFLANYQMSEVIANEWDITSYVKTITMLVLACALMFQLPMVALFLSRAGLLTPSIMRIYRRHALVVILVISAIITPPDIVSQILLALPIYILYEISITISAVVERNNARTIEKLREENLQRYE